MREHEPNVHMSTSESSSEPLLIDSLTADQVCREFARLSTLMMERDDSHGDGDQSEFAVQIENLFRQVKALPVRDATLARAVYVALARSEHRDFAAILMPDLAEADLEFALPIWYRLIGDSDDGVRCLAFDAVRIAAHDRPAIHFGFRVAMQLFEAYLYAECASRASPPGGSA